QLELRGSNTLTAQNGSISICHSTNSTISTSNANSNASAIYLNGTNTLTAARGNITISGNNSGYDSYYHGVDGIAMTGNITMTAANISINGSGLNNTINNSLSLPSTRGISFEGGNFTFTGNTSITGTAIVGSGVGFRKTNNITFNNGTAVINAKNNGTTPMNSGHGYVAAFGDSSSANDAIGVLNFNLNNANLSINASSINGSGISGSPGYNGCITINGSGNVSINGTSQNYDGIAYINFNASGLNGTAIITGSSTNKTGVLLLNTSQNNVTITGNATGNGSGV
ncbi:hypothetical protein ACAI28_004617, partial [Escherichia coli]